MRCSLFSGSFGNAEGVGSIGYFSAFTAMWFDVANLQDLCVHERVGVAFSSIGEWFEQLMLLIGKGDFVSGLHLARSHQIVQLHPTARGLPPQLGTRPSHPQHSSDGELAGRPVQVGVAGVGRPR